MSPSGRGERWKRRRRPERWKRIARPSPFRRRSAQTGGWCETGHPYRTPHPTPQGKEVIAVKKIVVRKLETIKTTRPVMYDPRLCWVA